MTNNEKAFALTILFDNGASVKNITVVVIAPDKEKAFDIARKTIEQSSDDLATLISAREMCSGDVIVAW